MSVDTSLSENGVYSIKLNRPDKRNALDVHSLSLIIDALQEARLDSKIRIVVITGVDQSFSAGGDISEMTDRFGKALVTKNRIDSYLNEIVRLIRKIKRPVIAKVNGICFGAGMVLALSCDLIYSNESAKFGFSYANIGLIAESSYFISRFIGLHKAKEIVFRRKVLSGREAFDFGLINNVFSDDLFDGEVNKIADELADGPVQTLGLAKEVLNNSYEQNLDSHLNFESLAQGAAFTTEEHREGRDAFFNKRKSDFKSV